MTDVNSLPFYDMHTEARAKIDEDIRRLTQQIWDLRLARNALAPIARLPVELMRAVFLLSRNSSNGRVALTISWVSRGWRELALRIPHLWHKIDTTNLKWIDACSTRSRCLSLDVSLQIDQSTDAAICVPSILEALPRIRNLDLDAIIFDDDPDEVRVMEFEGWVEPAPRLTHLTLRGFSLPKTILNGNFPSLQFLYLSGCHFALDPFPASDSLRQLTIVGPDIPLQLSQFLDVLRFSPNIEELDLDSAIDVFASPSPPSRDSLHLSSLCKFGITQQLTDITLSLFQQITLPHDVDLEVNVDNDDISNVPALIEAVIDSGRLLTRSYKALTIAANDQSATFHLEDATSNLEGFTSFHLGFGTGAADLALVMNRLDPLLPALSNIEKLDLYGGAAGKDEPLSHFETFAGYRNLSDLQISGVFFLPFIQCISALARNIPEEGPISDADVLFPALTQLTLDRVYFTEVQFEILVMWLLGRTRISRRLSKVVLSYTRITPSQVEEIEAVAGKVTQLPWGR